MATKVWSAGDKVNASDLNNAVVPTGSVIPFAGSSAPTDWLLCDGSAISRTTHAILFALVGTTYGSGDGSTTFNLPNLKGKIPVGYNSSEAEFDALGETGGAKTHQLTTAELASHSHAISTYDASYMDDSAYIVGADGPSAGPTAAGATTQSAGSGTAHNNLQPYIVLNYIIKT